MENRKKTDLLWICLPMVVMFLLHILNLNKVNYLKLDVNNLNFISWFSSNFLHNSWNHLLGNIALYLIFILLLYLLVENRKGFYRLFLAMILLLPLFKLVLTLTFLEFGAYPENIPYETGYSAIVSGFLGCLVYPVIKKLNRLTDLSKWMLGFLIFLLIAVLLPFRIEEILPLSIFCGVLFLLLILFTGFKNGIGITEKKTRAAFPNWKVYIQFIFALGFLLSSAFILIPESLANSGTITNIFSHYIGLIFGYLSGTILVLGQA